MARFGTRPRLATMFQGPPSSTRALGGESKLLQKKPAKSTTAEPQIDYEAPASGKEYQEWLQDLKQNEPELYQIYQERGGEALNAALDERTAKHDSILSKLDKYKDGDAYDIATALKDDAVKASDLTSVGFSQSDVDTAIETGQTMVRHETIVSKLDKYKGDEGYDIAKALIDKAITPSELRDVGFEDSAVADAVKFAGGAPRRNTITEKLDKYKADEGYNIDKALQDDAVSSDDLIFLGFEEPDVNDAVKRKGITKKLNPYKGDAGYSITKALSEKAVTGGELTLLGFSESDINKAIQFNKSYDVIRSYTGTNNGYDFKKLVRDKGAGDASALLKDIGIDINATDLTKYAEAYDKYREALNEYKSRFSTGYGPPQAYENKKLDLTLRFYPKWSYEYQKAKAIKHKKSFAKPLVWVPELGEAVSVTNLAEIQAKAAKEQAQELATMGIGGAVDQAIATIIKLEPEYETGTAKVTIPISQEELKEIAKAEAEGRCVGEMATYYTEKIFNVRGRDKDGNWTTITVGALDEKTAQAKAEDYGIDKVAYVTRNIGTETGKTVQIPTGTYIATFADGSTAKMVEFVDPESKQLSLLPQDTVEQLRTMSEYEDAKGSDAEKLGLAYQAATKQYEEFQAEIKSGKIKPIGNGEYIAKEDYEVLPKQWQEYADQFGATALGNRVDAYTNILKDYENEDGTYNIFTALTDPKDWQTSQQHQDAVAFLFGQDTLGQSLESLREQRITVTAPTEVPEGKYKYEGQPWYITLRNAVTPWSEESGQTFAQWMQRPGTMIGDIRYKLSKDKEFKEWYEKQGYPELVYGYGPMISPAGVIPGSGVAAKQVAQWLWNAPARTITKVAVKIPRLMTNPILKTIPQGAIMLTRMATVGIPVYYGVSKIGEAVQSANIQRKWNVFTSLPEKEKDKWARECGYDKWDGLNEAEQSVVLARYSVPTSYAATQWHGQVAQYTNKMVELASKGPEWLQQHAPKAAYYPAAVIAGAGIGLAEATSYMGQMPMIMTNIVLRVPTGEAGKYATDVGKGMLDFFRTMPGIVTSGPFGAGRMIGLFVLSPETALQLAGGKFAKFSPRYVPERAMAMELHTIRASITEGIKFSKAQTKLLAAMTAKQRMALGTEIVKALLEGKDYVKGFGKLDLKVSTVPYQKVVGNTLFHFTPDMRPFLKGKPVPITGKLYTSPHAAAYAGMQALVKGTKAVKPGIVEIRVPEGFTVKNAPIKKLIGQGKVIELEAPLGGVLEPIPGWTGKGVSANVYIGKYPIRRFTLQGVDTPITKLSAKKLVALRALAAKESIGDFFLGWHGRAQAIKENIAAGKRLQKTLEGIQASIKGLKKSPESVVGKDGRIISQIETPHPTSGLINEKVRGLIIDKEGRVLFTRDRADPANVYDAVGGSCNPKEVLIPESGKWIGDLPANKRPPVTWETAWRSQAKGELDVNVGGVEYLGMYRGKVGEHSIYGVRTYAGKVKSPKFDNIKAWHKYQQKKYGYKQPEIAEAFWWDGKSAPKGEVQPWFYDMLAAVADKYKWDMSKVKVAKTSSNYLRDPEFATRVKNKANPDLTSAERKQFEMNALTNTYDKMTLPGFRDYVYRGGVQLDLISELIKGRRQAVKWTRQKPAKAARQAMDNAKSQEKIRQDLGKAADNLPKPTDYKYLEDYMAGYRSGKAAPAKFYAELTRVLQAQEEFINARLRQEDMQPYIERNILDAYYANYLARVARNATAPKKAPERPIWEQVEHYGKPFPYDESYQGAFTYDVTSATTPYKGTQPQKYQKPTIPPKQYKTPTPKKHHEPVPLEVPQRVPPRPPRVPPPIPPGRPKLTTRTQKIELGQKFPKREGPALAVWRQGVYWVSVFPPFRTTGTKADVVYSREKPPWGSVIVRGKRSPQKTLRGMGKIPNLIEVPMGVVTARIRNGRTLTFSRRNGRKRGKVLNG